MNGASVVNRNMHFKKLNYYSQLRNDHLFLCGYVPIKKEKLSYKISRSFLVFAVGKCQNINQAFVNEITCSHVILELSFY